MQWWGGAWLVGPLGPLPSAGLEKGGGEHAAACLSVQEGLQPGSTFRGHLLEMAKVVPRERQQRRSAAVRHDLKQLYRHRGPMPEADWFQLLEDYRQVAEILPSERLLGRKTPVRPHQA